MRRMIVCTSSPLLLPESIAAFVPKKALPIGGRATWITRRGKSEDSARPEIPPGCPLRNLIMARHRSEKVSDWSKDAALRFAAQQKTKQIQDAKVIRDQNDFA